MTRRCLSQLMLCVALLLSPSAADAGSIFVSGHDPVWHAGMGGNATGAANLARTAIEYARNGSSLPFLFVESLTAPIPAGNAREAPFLTPNLGYLASDYVVADFAFLSGLANFRTALNSYSAIVVASDHGGMLTAAELGFLNGRADEILDYLNAGGGLAAFAQSNSTGLLGATPRYGFLPFLVASVDFNSQEVANQVTPFGASLGLTNFDVNGNFSHNLFSATGGMTPVDLFNGDPNQILSLAYRGPIGPGGVVPEPSGLALAVTGLVALLVLRRRPSA